jgi:hypothetical protein
MRRRNRYRASQSHLIRLLCVVVRPMIDGRRVVRLPYTELSSPRRSVRLNPPRLNTILGPASRLQSPIAVQDTNEDANDTERDEDVPLLGLLPPHRSRTQLSGVVGISVKVSRA